MFQYLPIRLTQHLTRHSAAALVLPLILQARHLQVKPGTGKQLQQVPARQIQLLHIQ